MSQKHTGVSLSVSNILGINNGVIHPCQGPGGRTPFRAHFTKTDAFCEILEPKHQETWLKKQAEKHFNVTCRYKVLQLTFQYLTGHTGL